MVKQDLPHRPRQFARMCVPVLFAGLLAACTPLTGVKTSEQDKQDKAEGDRGPDGGVLGEQRENGSSGSDSEAKPDGGTEESAGGAGAESEKKGAARGGAGNAGGMDAQRPEDKADTAGTGDSKAAEDNTGAAARGGSDMGELVDVTCVPLYVQEARGQFVQVRCQTPIQLGTDLVEYLALPTKTQQTTCSRFSELASSALLRAAPIGARVNPTGRGNDSGCEESRCRTIRAFFQGM